MTDRKQALIELRDKVKAGDDAGFRRANRAAFSTPCQDLALQLREEHCRHAYKGSLDAAKALHEAVLPGWFIRSLVQRGEEIWKVVIWPDFSIVGIEDMKAGTSSNPARAWLIVILEALIAQEDT